MVFQPIFIALTVLGNSVILISASLFYHLEFGVNPQLKTFLDALWWSVATVSTVGYGDVVPITQTGRVLGICTVIVGSGLFWSYTAVFAEALLARDLNDFETQLRSLNKTLKALEKSESLEEHELRGLIETVKKQLHTVGQKP